MKKAQDGVRTRESIRKLAAWDSTLLWYAKGVAAMQARPLDDPRSWRYQAAVHGYDRATDPLARQSDRLPADQAEVWNQCQHNSWFFLPWHRVYLAYFEQIVRADILALDGPDDWALPYWNYSEDHPDARLVRSEFCDPRLPDGSENTLAKARRGRTQQAAKHGAATGDFGLDADYVVLERLTKLPLRRRAQRESFR